MGGTRKGGRGGIRGWIHPRLFRLEEEGYSRSPQLVFLGLPGCGIRLLGFEVVEEALLSILSVEVNEEVGGTDGATIDLAATDPDV